MALSDAKPCNATTKRSKRTCRNPAVLGSTKCRMHGGKTPRGIESANFRHGRYSADLPSRLAARYREAASDPNILDQRAEIAVLQVRISELLQRIDEAEAGQWFKRLNKARIDFNAVSGDPKKAAPLLNHLLHLVEEGAAAWMIWDDITRTMEQRRKLVADQAKAEQSADLLISLEKLIIIFGVIKEQIHEHVPSRDARAAIAAGLDPIFADLIPGFIGREGEA